MCFRAINVDVRVEEASSHGRADMVVHIEGQVFIFEFKMARSKDGVEAILDAAFTQMRERGYADKYLHGAKSVYLVGVACGREARNLLEVRAEQAGR